MTNRSTPYLRRFALSMTCVLLIFSAAMSTTHAQTRAYVSNTNDNTVSVIDTATNTVIATIPVDSPFDVAITPDGTRVYVVNASDTVTVIDTATNTVIATILAGSHAHAIAFTPDGSLAYVTSFFTDTVLVVETVTNTVVDTVPVGSAPLGLGWLG